MLANTVLLLPRLGVDFLDGVFFLGAFDLCFFLVSMPILSTTTGSSSDSLSSLSLMLLLLSLSLSSSSSSSLLLLLCIVHLFDFLDFLLDITLLDFLGTGMTINRLF